MFHKPNILGSDYSAGFHDGFEQGKRFEAGAARGLEDLEAMMRTETANGH
jgi:hypothetical protein